MNEVWLMRIINSASYQPLKEGYIQINYFRTDGEIMTKKVSGWGDVTDVTLGDWPDGIDFETKVNMVPISMSN